jgi:TldD protein
MKDQMFEALKRSTADYAEIRISVEDGLGLAFRGAEAEQASASSGRGGIVRACTKGGWGIVSFDTLDDLPRQVTEACRCAGLVGREKTELAAVPPVDMVHPATMTADFRGVSLDEKIGLIQRYNEIIRKTSPAVKSTLVAYQENFRTVYFASTAGSYFMEERPRVALVLNATARDGTLVQSAHESFASIHDYRCVLNMDSTAREVADRAVALLKAPKCEGGAHSVILNQNMAGVFIHEAFGHLSEADFLYENPRMRNLMVLGREMGLPTLNVVDDGTRPGLLGTHFCDDEGTPTSRVPLITAGVLTAHMHSRETAAKMGEAPTGNVRACWKNQPPIVRMRNTFIDNGDVPVPGLFKGVDQGIYACDAFGGQTEFEMFTFSAGYGYRIENGQKGELVRDVTLTGNVFETLRRIDGIGNDLRLPQSAGGCGKNGQGPLPVTCGSPHIRIRNVVIGGK